MAAPLTHRLIMAAIDALDDDDPVLVIGVGEHEIKIGWLPVDQQHLNPTDRPHQEGTE
jgi:hypothetical protein